MAWETIYSSSVSFSRTTTNDPFKALSLTIGKENGLDKYDSIKVTIEGMGSAILPKINTLWGTTGFGSCEVDAESHVTFDEDFETYDRAVLYFSNVNTTFSIAFKNDNTDELSKTINVAIEIGEDDPEPTPSKKPAPIGVKEAMRHFVSTLPVEVEPKNTIKGLTKQIRDPRNEYPTIQNARTIAEIWEQAAILNGYESEEDNAIED